MSNIVRLAMRAPGANIDDAHKEELETLFVISPTLNPCPFPSTISFVDIQYGFGLNSGKTYFTIIPQKPNTDLYRNYASFGTF